MSWGTGERYNIPQVTNTSDIAVRLFLETEADKGHGRIELRKCIASSQIDWLKQKPEWARSGRS